MSAWNGDTSQPTASTRSVANTPLSCKTYPESRFVALGFLENRLHVLCFTPTVGGIRVISFRKANRREEKEYEQTPTADR